MASREHLAIYPGSFDPISNGHLDVIRRGRRLFDRLIVAVGRNPSKTPLFSPDERLAMVRTLVDRLNRDEPEHAPATVEAFSGLTVDFARRMGATVLLKGIRNLSDLQSEVQQALTNRQVAGLETAFVVAGQDFAYTSSSLIRQVTALGTPESLNALQQMVPPLVLSELRRKKDERHPLLEALRVANGGGDEGEGGS